MIEHSQPRELSNEVAFASHSREERAWSEACWGEDLGLDDVMGAVEWPQLRCVPPFRFDQFASLFALT